MWKAIFLAFAAVSTVLSGLMPGGFNDVDPNCEEARRAVNFAVVQHNTLKDSNDSYLSQAVQWKIQRQVSNRPWNLMINDKPIFVSSVILYEKRYVTHSKKTSKNKLG